MKSPLYSGRHAENRSRHQNDRVRSRYERPQTYRRTHVSPIRRRAIIDENYRIHSTFDERMREKERRIRDRHRSDNRRRPSRSRSKGGRSNRSKPSSQNERKKKKEEKHSEKHSSRRTQRDDVKQESIVTKAMEFLALLLRADPRDRLQAEQALFHPWFKELTMGVDEVDRLAVNLNNIKLDNFGDDLNTKESETDFLYQIEVESLDGTECSYKHRSSQDGDPRAADRFKTSEKERAHRQH